MNRFASPAPSTRKNGPREAVTSVDRMRRTRLSPEEVPSAWCALYEGRWTVVESVERDGRRFLVVRPDAPFRDGARGSVAEVAGNRPPTPPRLSAQEARVLAALGKGYSNKLIAYELGVAISTVSTLLARAARKLGCKTRIALAEAGRALPQPQAEQGGREAA